MYIWTSAFSTYYMWVFIMNSSKQWKSPNLSFLPPLLEIIQWKCSNTMKTLISRTSNINKPLWNHLQFCIFGGEWVVKSPHTSTKVEILPLFWRAQWYLVFSIALLLLLLILNPWMPLNIYAGFLTHVIVLLTAITLQRGYIFSHNFYRNDKEWP